MAARLASILSAVQETVETYVPGVTYRIGSRYVQERVAGARVVWVPGKDVFAAASGNGRNGRSVRTRRAEVQAYVFAADLEAAEALVHALAYAIHVNCHGSYDLESAEWFTPEWLERGEGCLMKLSFDIPITEPAKPTIIPTVAWDPTNVVAGDGYLDSGES